MESSLFFRSGLFGSGHSAGSRPKPASSSAARLDRGPAHQRRISRRHRLADCQLAVALHSARRVRSRRRQIAPYHPQHARCHHQPVTPSPARRANVNPRCIQPTQPLRFSTLFQSITRLRSGYQQDCEVFIRVINMFSTGLSTVFGVINSIWRACSRFNKSLSGDCASWRTRSGENATIRIVASPGTGMSTTGKSAHRHDPGQTRQPKRNVSPDGTGSREIGDRKRSERPDPLATKPAVPGISGIPPSQHLERRG